MEPSPKTTPPPRGFGSELKNLHQNGSASAAELREFLSKLRGRSPQEVVGIVSSSLLIKSMVQAILATIAIIAFFTIVPYLVWGPNNAKKPEVASPPTATAESSAAETTPGESSAGNTSASAASTGTPASTASAEADPAAAAKVLGIDESKAAPADKNPLDGSLDKLIDGLD